MGSHLMSFKVIERQSGQSYITLRLLVKQFVVCHQSWRHHILKFPGTMYVECETL